MVDDDKRRIDTPPSPAADSVVSADAMDEKPEEPKTDDPNGLSFRIVGKDGEFFWLRVKGFNYMRIVMYLGAAAGLIKMVSKLLEVGLW